MALRLAIPEASALRRIAAALASALETTQDSARLTMDVSASAFFRCVPWSGEVRARPRLRNPLDATAGQFFAGFNWDGTAPMRLATAPGAKRSEAGRTVPSAILLQLLDES